MVLYFFKRIFLEKTEFLPFTFENGRREHKKYRQNFALKYSYRQKFTVWLQNIVKFFTNGAYNRRRQTEPPKNKGVFFEISEIEKSKRKSRLLRIKMQSRCEKASFVPFLTRNFGEGVDSGVKLW